MPRALPNSSEHPQRASRAGAQIPQMNCTWDVWRPSWKALPQDPSWFTVRMRTVVPECLMMSVAFTQDRSATCSMLLWVSTYTAAKSAAADRPVSLSRECPG